MKEQPKTVQKSRLLTWRGKYRKLLVDELTPKIHQILKKEKFENEKEQIKSSFLTGKSRTGKTIEAHRLMFEWHRMQFVNRKNTDMLFMNVEKLLENFRQLQIQHEQFNELFAKYSKIGLLVLDDLGAHSLSDWSMRMLYRLIDTRYEHMKTTIYTSNLHFEELTERMNDDRIVGRIKNDCQNRIIEFTNDPYI